MNPWLFVKFQIDKTTKVTRLANSFVDMTTIINTLPHLQHLYCMGPTIPHPLTSLQMECFVPISTKEQCCPRLTILPMFTCYLHHGP